MVLRLALVKTGDAAPAVAKRYGDYDRMFLDCIEDPSIAVTKVEAHRGEQLPRDVDAVMITGSPASVMEREPWADALAVWTAELIGRDAPVLGVCYGHQILAHATGGEVGLNPDGYEIGTIDVIATDAGEDDPLVVPGRYNSLHTDAVVELPPGAVALAKSARCAIQAFSMGDRVWGVQFHPEISGAVMRDYVEERRDRVIADAERRGEEPSVALARIVVDETPDGPRLLRRFVEIAKEKVG